MNRRRRPAVPLVLALLVALASGGCSGGGDPTAGGAATAPPVTTEAPATTAPPATTAAPTTTTAAPAPAQSGGLGPGPSAYHGQDER